MNENLLPSRRTWGLASVALALVACAGPGPQPASPPLSTPTQLGLSSVSAAPISAQWWRDWGDEALSRLVEQALAQHPSLAQARARVARAQAVADVVRSGGEWQAGFSADLTRQRYTEHGLVPAPIAGRTWNTGNVLAGMAWQPDFFGLHEAEQAVARDQTRAVQAEAAQVATGLSTQVVRGYVALARLVAQKEVAQRALAQREELRHLTQMRVQAGLDSQVEQTLADGALPDARGQIELLDEHIQLLRHQLAVLTGQAPDALASLNPLLARVHPQGPPPALSLDLLARRADVVAARWRVEAAGQEVAVARAQFYPSINLQAFVGLNAIGLDKLLDLGSRQIGATPAIRLPLFDSGRLRSQLQGKHADLEAAAAQYNSVVLQAVLEARDALTSLDALARQQREQAQALASAEAAQGLAQRRYGAGLGNYLLVLQTETQVLAQRRAALDLQARSLDAQATLIKALGGGWSADSLALNEKSPS